MIAAPLAFFNLGVPELIVIGLIGILLFGKRLPEIGKSLGKTIVEFKKGLGSAGEEINKGVSEETDKPVITQPKRQVKQIAGGEEP